MNVSAERTILSYRSCDIEARLGLPAGRHTTPSILAPFLLGCLFMLCLVTIAFFVEPAAGSKSESAEWRRWVASLVLRYHGIAPAEVFLSCWSVAFLILKWLKIRGQRKALDLQLIPRDPGFVLTAATAVKVIAAIEAGVEGAPKFFYLKRILSSLRSMRNVGRVADVDDMLQSAAANDQSIMESGYTILKGFTWAIPVLGFIGTVIGLTEAMGNFGTALAPVARGDKADVQVVSQGLVQVLTGLDTAFVTTGEALVLVFFIHLAHVFVRDRDETLLDDAREEAHAQIGARVRLDPGVG